MHHLKIDLPFCFTFLNYNTIVIDILKTILPDKSVVLPAICFALTVNSSALVPETLRAFAEIE